MTAGGEVVTRHADTGILNGVTRLGLLGLLQREGLRLVERPFSVAEAKAAREAFLTSTTNFVLPVVCDRRHAGRQRPSRPDHPQARAQPIDAYVAAQGEAS